jgi:hypothetical protein
MHNRPITGIMIGIAGFLAGVLLFFVLTGCSASGPPSAASTSQSPSVRQRALTLWLEYARCVRVHGAPDFPDPVVDNRGRGIIPSSSNPERVKAEAGLAQGACGSILSRLPPVARQQQGSSVTPAELTQLTSFARCVRQHGIPGFPDPRPDGTFVLTPAQKTQINGPAFQACRQYSSGGKG